MPYFLSPFGNQQAFDAAGNPLVGGSWRTFRAGTTTPETTYTSQAGTTPQGTTMTLDAMGLPVNGPVWMLGGQALKFRLFNAASVQLEEYDNITGIGDVNVAPDEWVLFNAVPTYVSATVFTLAGDQTNIFTVRRRLKTTNTGGAVYSTIITAVFSAGITTITVANTFGVLAVGLSAVSYSLLAVVNTSIPNISVGPVSQTAGVPTGAVIERGSNANGEFVRFADGTQICTTAFNVIAINSSANAFGSTAGTMFFVDTSWTYPAVFIARPSLTSGGGGDRTANFIDTTGSVTTTTTASHRLWANNNTVTHYLTLSAIGRWF